MATCAAWPPAQHGHLVQEGAICDGGTALIVLPLYQLYIGIADGMSIARVWACQYGERRMARSNQEGRIRKVYERRVFSYLQIDTGPRRSPSACSEILKQRVIRYVVTPAGFPSDARGTGFGFERGSFFKKRN